LGGDSLISNTTASNNTAIGTASLYVNTTGGFNTALGMNSLRSNTTAGENTAVGNTSMYSNTTGFANVGCGAAALYSNTTGVLNNCFGYGAGYHITTGSLNTILGAYNGNQGGLDIRTSSSNIVLSDGSGNPRLYIDSSGRMLLNTTTHTNGRLNVTESLNVQPCLGLRSSYASNTGNFVLFTSDNGTGAGAISHINASTVAYNTSSDYRLKQNVTYDFDATTRLKQLQPARFSWNHDDTNTLVDGFIAHEVQEVVPEAITGTKDAVDDDGNPVYQGIDQSKLVPLLVKTIQELEARITTLEGA